MNYKFLAKHGVSLAFGLALIGIAIMIFPIMGGLEAFNNLPEDVNQRAISKEGGIFGYGITVAIAFAIIAFGLALLFGIINVFTNFKDSKKFLIGLGVIVVLFIAMSAAASTDAGPRLMKTLLNPEYGLGDGVKFNTELFKRISGGINGTMLLCGVAIAAWILGEIWNFFKNA